MKPNSTSSQLKHDKWDTFKTWLSRKKNSENNWFSISSFHFYYRSVISYKVCRLPDPFSFVTETSSNWIHGKHIKYETIFLQFVSAPWFPLNKQQNLNWLQTSSLWFYFHTNKYFLRFVSLKTISEQNTGGKTGINLAQQFFEVPE